MSNAFLILNSGSSSLKYALYSPTDLACLRVGMHEFKQNIPNATYYQEALEKILSKTDETIIAAGHRIVHGGEKFHAPTLITEKTFEDLKSLTPLAPLHQPFNLLGIEVLQDINPSLPQVVCFDTAFHRTQPKINQLYALPKLLSDDGIIRYGFHGLSYEYICSVLPQHAKTPHGKTIIAHLGNGASLCGLQNLKSISSTMGFTALEGLMMGTRCGHIDPGVILYLLTEKNMNAAEVTDLLYKQSGLLGVSGISSDIRDLMESDTPDANTAIDLFCHYIVRAIGSLTAELEGLETLVFTAGIGEHQPIIRQKICAALSWLGLAIDQTANQNNDTYISANDSGIEVLIIPTDEEYIIAHHTKALLT